MLALCIELQSLRGPVIGSNALVGIIEHYPVDFSGLSA